MRNHGTGETEYGSSAFTVDNPRAFLSVCTDGLSPMSSLLSKKKSDRSFPSIKNILSYLIYIFGDSLNRLSWLHRETIQIVYRVKMIMPV